MNLRCSKILYLLCYLFVTGQLENFYQGKEKAVLEESDVSEDHDPAVMEGLYVGIWVYVYIFVCMDGRHYRCQQR